MRGLYQSNLTRAREALVVGADPLVPALKNMLVKLPDMIHGEITTMNDALLKRQKAEKPPEGLKEWALATWAPLLAEWLSFRVTHAADLGKIEVLRAMLAFRDRFRAARVYAFAHGFLPIVALQEAPSLLDQAMCVALGPLGSATVKTVGDLTADDWLQIAAGPLGGKFAKDAGGIAGLTTVAKYALVGVAGVGAIALIVALARSSR